MSRVYWELEQRTEEWYRLRHSSIGGSDSKSLFVKDLSDSSIFYRILAEQMEDFTMDEDPFISRDMQRGIDLEPDARFQLYLETNVTFHECGLIKNDKFDFLHLSPDGVTKDLTIATEIKCPDKKTHAEYLLKDKVPEEYVYQIVSYFYNIPTLETLYFASYRPENNEIPLFVKELNRESELIIGWTRAKKDTPKQPICKTINQLVEDMDSKAEELYLLLKKAHDNILNNK